MLTRHFSTASITTTQTGMHSFNSSLMTTRWAVCAAKFSFCPYDAEEAWTAQSDFPRYFTSSWLKPVKEIISYSFMLFDNHPPAFPLEMTSILRALHQTGCLHGYWLPYWELSIKMAACISTWTDFNIESSPSKWLPAFPLELTSILRALHQNGCLHGFNGALCALRGIQNSMEAILAWHPALSVHRMAGLDGNGGCAHT